MTDTQTAAAATPQMDMNYLVDKYVMLRDLKKEREDNFNESMKDLASALEDIQGLILEHLKTHGVDSIKTKHGTAYASTRYTASLADPKAFMDFVISTQKYELMDRRANATAVRDYVEETKELPPGCNLSAIRTLGVRRAPGT